MINIPIYFNYENSRFIMYILIILKFFLCIFIIYVIYLKRKNKCLIKNFQNLYLNNLELSVYYTDNQFLKKKELENSIETILRGDLNQLFCFTG